MARHWANRPANMKVIPAWFEHLGENFSYKGIHLKKVFLTSDSQLLMCWKHYWNLFYPQFVDCAVMQNLFLVESKINIEKLH